MQMLPMSLYESRESNGAISLSNLFANSDMKIDGITSDMTIENLIFAACRGGWPASLKPANPDVQLLIAKDYVNSICKVEISTVDNTMRDETLARLILRSYARNISTLAKKSSMLKDLRAQLGTLAENTFDSYVVALKKLFVIQDIESWNPSIRSATAIRSSQKRGLVDPSIAIAALGLSPESLQMDLKTFGFIFESMCIRDLKAYSQALGSTISYYHDRWDVVLHLADGSYALIEFKLGGKEIEEVAAHLLEIKQLINEANGSKKQAKLREPDLLMIITGGPIAYTRPDGVKVVPLACLKD